MEIELILMLNDLWVFTDMESIDLILTDLLWNIQKQ